jgi:hypothetical protein
MSENNDSKNITNQEDALAVIDSSREACFFCDSGLTDDCLWYTMCDDMMSYADDLQDSRPDFTNRNIRYHLYRYFHQTVCCGIKTHQPLPTCIEMHIKRLWPAGENDDDRKFVGYKEA